jgi:uncharacterized membrane protein (DUF485 family)
LTLQTEGREMYSHRLPLILQFIFKHAARIGSCGIQFDAKRELFFTTKRDNLKVIGTFAFLVIYIVFAIIRTLQAKLSSHPDFAICYALTLGLLLMAGCILTVLGIASDVEVSVAFTLLYRGSIRFRSKTSIN